MSEAIIKGLRMSRPIPHVIIESPFPRSSLPALFCWTERIRSSVADDSVPDEIEAWMRWQEARMTRSNVATWGMYRDGDIGGYFEIVEHETGASAALEYFAIASCIFRREMWGRENGSHEALNLCLQEVFVDVTTTIFFPVYKHNESMQRLLWSAGAANVGLIAPRMLDGVEKATEMFALTRWEWEKKNAAWIAARAAKVEAVGV